MMPFKGRVGVVCMYMYSWTDQADSIKFPREIIRPPSYFCNVPIRIWVVFNWAHLMKINDVCVACINVHPVCWRSIPVFHFASLSGALLHLTEVEIFHVYFMKRRDRTNLKVTDASSRPGQTCETLVVLFPDRGYLMAFNVRLRRLLVEPVQVARLELP